MTSMDKVVIVLLLSGLLPASSLKELATSVRSTGKFQLKQRMMNKAASFLVIALLCADWQTPVASLKEFSLARYDTLTYANNAVIDIYLIGEGYPGITQTNAGALECHTDDTHCCRNVTGEMVGGEWYDPNGDKIPSAKEDIHGTSNYYRTRDHMVIRLNSRDGTTPIAGVYRCVIPGAGGVNITRHITLTHGGSCTDLPLPTNGVISYTPPRGVVPTLLDGHQYQGTVATYSCSSGYQLVGGSTQRACGVSGVNWNGTDPSCGTYGIMSATSPPSTQPPTTEAPTTIQTDPPIPITDTDVTTDITPFINTQQSTTSGGTTQSSTQAGSGPSEVSGVVGGVVAVLWFIISIVIIAILVGYILYLKRQLKEHHNRGQMSGAQCATVGEALAPEYEVMEGGGAEYEEIDKVKEKRGQPRPPRGDYELTQCAAYGPVLTDNAMFCAICA